MNDISIGAVGTAIIAGLVSLLGLIIGKEQKVSEFRQAWIDELRKCLIAYLVNINAITDAVRLAISKNSPIGDLSENYKNLNQAHHGIILRLNDKENTSISLIESMKKFENIASNNSTLTVDNIRDAEEAFLISSKNLLKYEWKVVKRGEKTYFVTKYIVIALIIMMAVIFGILWRERVLAQKSAEPTHAPGAAGATNQMVCQISTQSDGATEKLDKPSRSMQPGGRGHVLPQKLGQAVCNMVREQSAESDSQALSRP